VNDRLTCSPLLLGSLTHIPTVILSAKCVKSDPQVLGRKAIQGFSCPLLRAAAHRKDHGGLARVTVPWGPAPLRVAGIAKTTGTWLELPEKGSAELAVTRALAQLAKGASHTSH